MKHLLFAFVLTLLVFTVYSGTLDDEREKFKQSHEKCIQESGLDPKVALKSLDEEVGNDKYKCYLKCLMMDMGSLDDTGNVATELMKGLPTELKKEAWEKVVDTCKDITEDDICEKAYKLAKCLTDETKKATKN